MAQNDAAQQPLYAHSGAAFEKVFKTHFKALHAYAYTFVRDSPVAEDMVQNIFVKLWEKNDSISIHTSVSAYLYRAVYNECLNHLKHEKVKITHQTASKQNVSITENNVPEQLKLKELEGKLFDALAELPEGCRTIFQMSRFEALKYREIADKLGISIKTVENQMGKALKVLRLKLADYLSILLCLFYLFYNI